MEQPADQYTRCNADTLRVFPDDTLILVIVLLYKLVIPAAGNQIFGGSLVSFIFATVMFITDPGYLASVLDQMRQLMEEGKPEDICPLPPYGQRDHGVVPAP